MVSGYPNNKLIKPPGIVLHWSRPPFRTRCGSNAMNLMRPKLRRAILSVALLVAAFLFGQPVRALQAQDALNDRVAQLLEKLESDDAEESKSAESALKKLGPRILPLIPMPDDKSKNPQKAERIRSLIQALGEQQSQNLSATIVTIQGKGIRLSDAVKALQQQSGNVLVDLREQTGQEVLNPAIDLDIEKKPFFEALDTVARLANLELSFYTAENAIGLINAPMPPATPGSPEPEKKASNEFVRYLDAFRVSLSRIGLSRDYRASMPGHTANLQMELVWEPRLKPLLIKLQPDQIKAVDDKGNEIKASVSGESMELSIRAENPILDLNVNLEAPDRAAQSIKSLEVVAELTVPLANRSLGLKKITEQGAEVKAGKAGLRLMNFESEAPVWKVTAELTSPPPDGAEKLDSYRQMNFVPQVFLIKADGGRLPLNGGFSSTGGSSPGSVVYEFLFVDIPGRPEDHGLLVEVPGELKTFPLKWQFENIPLP